jgi:hypothetical protein
MINIDLEVGAEQVPFGKMHLAAATGRLEFDFCPTNLKAGILDLWATNILVALLPKLDPENESKVNCVIARCRLENGVIKPEVLGLDTTRIRVATEGSIDLSGNAFDLKLTPVPKRPELLAFELPLSIKGTLREPTIGMGKLPLVRTAGRMTLNTVLFPLDVLVGKRLPADGSDVCPCADGDLPAEKRRTSTNKEENEKTDAKKKPVRRGIFKKK